MAKQTTVSLIDDLNGKPADETVSFGYDGVNYEIELTTKNAAKLRGELAAWAMAGRKLGRLDGSRHRTPDAPAVRVSIARDESDSIREWGRLNGFPVSIRGRIAFLLVDAYRADIAEGLVAEGLVADELLAAAL
jgi:hypothetical protein